MLPSPMTGLYNANVIHSGSFMALQISERKCFFAPVLEQVVVTTVCNVHMALPQRLAANLLHKRPVITLMYQLRFKAIDQAWTI